MGPEPPPPAVRAPLERVLGTDLGGVRVHRGEHAAALSGRLDAHALTTGEDIHLPRHHGSLESRPAASLLAHELTHVVQQRRLGSALPPERSEPGRALEREARTVQRSWESGRLPLVPRQGADVASSIPHSAMTASDHGSAHPLPPDRPDAVDGGEPPGAVSAVQRAATTEPASPPVSAGAGGAVGRGDDDAQLEDLAQKLYHHIRWRLRSELLLDRERAGLVTDLS